MMKKRMVLLSLSLAACIGLVAGCGGNAENNATTGSSGESNASTSSGNAVEINFQNIWVGADSKAEVFNQMIEGFNTEFDGKYKIVVEEQTDYDMYRDKLRTQISTGDAPDIFTVGSYADLELFSQSGKLMDLTEFLENDDMKSQFVSGSVDAAKVDGKNYGFPYENAVVPIMYNQKLLTEAGVEELPQSFEEFFDVCEKLKAIDVYPTAQMTADNAFTSMLWYSYALAACGGPDIYEKGFDDPAFVEAADLIKRMYDYTAPDAVGGDATVVNGHFFNERTGIYTNGSWILGRIKTEGVEGLYDNLVLAPGLSYNGENGGAYINQVQAYFCAGAQTDPAKEEGIKEFFKYICDKERVTELANSSGALFLIDIDSTQLTDPVQAELAKQSSEATFTIGHFQGSVPTTVANAFPAALESLVLGDVDSQGFVDMLKEANE